MNFCLTNSLETTGTQGGAVIRALQASPEASTISIHAIVRDPSSASSKKLESQGITLHKGNLTDLPSLETALKGIDTGFLVTIPQPNAEAEVTQGKTFIDAAKSAGVSHIVFSSVGSAERNTGVPHFESKREVEKYLIDSGISYTIIRPVAFMDNYPLEGAGRFLGLGMTKTAIGNKPLQLIAAEDIGVFAAKAIVNPEAWRGREFELAGDELTIEGHQLAFEKALGKGKPWVAWVPWILLKAMLPVDFYLMLIFFGEDGYKADIPALKKEHPGLLTFEEFLQKKVKSKSD